MRHFFLNVFGGVKSLGVILRQILSAKNYCVEGVSFPILVCDEGVSFPILVCVEGVSFPILVCVEGVSFPILVCDEGNSLSVTIINMFGNKSRNIFVILMLLSLVRPY